MEHVGADNDATVCLEDANGNRSEIDVKRKETVVYVTSARRDV
jgi:hypothetical protein